MDQNQVPEDIASIIKECWPDDIITEFDTDESYFYDIQQALERDLRKISGASLRWWTEIAEGDDWQSYHVYFLAPNADGFEFDAETEDGATKTQGHGWYGYAVSISLAASMACIVPSEYCEFEDGSLTFPDIETPTYDEETGARIDVEAEYQKMLGDDAYAAMDAVRAGIAAVLEKHELTRLENDVLDLPTPWLAVDEAVHLDPPVCVRDTFFFRGA